jgi:hypothetical protein
MANRWFLARGLFNLAVNPFERDDARICAGRVREGAAFLVAPNVIQYYVLRYGV